MADMILDIPIFLIWIVSIFLIIELIVYSVIKFVNKKFQWLIISKDKEPNLSITGLEKFFSHGFDSKPGLTLAPKLFTFQLVFPYFPVSS